MKKVLLTLVALVSLLTSVTAQRKIDRNFDGYKWERQSWGIAMDKTITYELKEGYSTYDIMGTLEFKFTNHNTIETFKVPRDILIICVGKSTYARCGIVVNVTPIEPEFEGQVVLEFSNTTNLPAKIYANEGACQFVFFKADKTCETSYADRSGKYQGQTGITLPKV